MASVNRRSAQANCLNSRVKFLSSPQKLWESGRFSLQRTVLKLAFSERLVYDRNSGYRTPKTSLPFRVLEGFLPSKNKMVPAERIELPTFRLQIDCTTAVLRRLTYVWHGLVKRPVKLLAKDHPFAKRFLYPAYILA